MEPRHRDALKRVYQADRQLTSEGREPETFHLHHRGANSREIHHPRWDRSWVAPSQQTIDDLGELGLVRVAPPISKARSFDLTMKGRAEGAAIVERVSIPIAELGRAPGLAEILSWLIDAHEQVPESFDAPTRLIERAVREGMIDITGREVLARRVLSLVDQGYLSGLVPDWDQATAEQLLARIENLEPTMKAHDSTKPGSASGPGLTILGPVINSQIAMGDITQYSVFADVLDRAYQEVDALEGVDVETKDEARGLLNRLRGVATATGDVATGAAGSLVAGVLARLIGLPPG